jgi:hypothetical protein
MPLDDTNWPDETVEIDATTEVLIRARSFIERGWCRRTAARNLLGYPVEATSKWAVSWCMGGALIAAAQLGNHAMWGFANRRLCAVISDDYVSAFNDRQETVEPILAAFDRAIAAGSASARSAVQMAQRGR